MVDAEATALIVQAEAEATALILRAYSRDR